MIMRSLITLVISITVCSLAFANDGAVGLDGGQLVFKNLKGVEMMQEDLLISPELVSVKYIFNNKTNKDIVTHVAFPISYPLGPDLNFDTEMKNPNGFYVEVNGLRKPFLTEVKTKDDYRITTHYWEQTFPAGQNTTVAHQYKPIYGSDVVESMIKTKYKGKDGIEPIRSYYRQIQKQFCLSDSQRKMIERDRHTFNELNYILTTANTWDGPIGVFNLTIQKGNRKYLFLCTQLDLKKKPNGDFTATEKNYRPQADLRLVFSQR